MEVTTARLAEAVAWDSQGDGWRQQWRPLRAGAVAGGGHGTIGDSGVPLPTANPSSGAGDPPPHADRWIFQRNVSRIDKAVLISSFVRLKFASSNARMNLLDFRWTTISKRSNIPFDFSI
ncbi:hypothetical protein GUJ93_ZPchr0007g5727 [Zizania palustris]|uniref:Uncharacterized protein n=1 Tax=Zizania palustris TaxID=103762 RepID=A0A8J5W5B7_ZIZPA|nr:hypothetical protein GUJ93_ZPchr0007g5727 [Zizania palustris]